MRSKFLRPLESGFLGLTPLHCWPRLAFSLRPIFSNVNWTAIDGVTWHALGLFKAESGRLTRLFSCPVIACLGPLAVIKTAEPCEGHSELLLRRILVLHKRTTQKVQAGHSGSAFTLIVLGRNRIMHRIKLGGVGHDVASWGPPPPAG